MAEIGLQDLVRARFVEALARRAAAHEGAARRVLDARLATLRETAGDRVEIGRPTAVGPAPPGRAALAELVGHAARSDAPAMPATLLFFRRTWSRLSADQRLAQSREALPHNAGPLNSQHVVHRSLERMRELSPAYLDRFVAYVDALLWLERAEAQSARTRRR